MIEEKTIQYKQTGLDWMPQVPEHWEIVRLKNLCFENLQYGLNIEASNYTYIGIRFLRTTDIDDNGKVSVDGIFLNEYLVDENYLLKQGDLIFSRSGTIGRCYLHNTDEKYCYAGFLVRFRPNRFTTSEWIYYYSFTCFFKQQVFSEAIESTILNFNGNKYANIKIPVPPISEQDAIVQYIKAQEEKINLFIQKKQRFIELLKEQCLSIVNNAVTAESKNWMWLRLKDIVTVNDEALTEKTDDDYLIKYIDIGNVNSYGDIAEIQEYTFKDAPSRARRIVKKGDVIISTVRTYLKAITLIDENLIASTGFAVLRPKENIISEYLNYALRAEYFIASVIKNSYGVSYPAINSSTLSSLKIVIPKSTEEQQQIINKIKTETATIDTAIAKAEREIELIKEYKEAMISEAVMGKRINHE